MNFTRISFFTWEINSILDSILETTLNSILHSILDSIFLGQNFIQAIIQFQINSDDSCHNEIEIKIIVHFNLTDIQFKN